MIDVRRVRLLPGSGFGRTLLVLASLLSLSPPVLAQTDAAASLGLALSIKSPTSRSADADVGPALVLRLKGEEGVGPSIGFNWFATRVTTTVDGREVALGRLNVKPVMLGAAYGRQLLPRIRADVSVEGGIAFTNVRGTGALRDAYAQAGVTNVGVSVSNPFAWRAQLTGWFDISSRYAITASIGYLGVRPTVTIDSSAGQRRETLGLGSIVTSVGFAYGIF
jgi:hypothetical protein